MVPREGRQIGDDLAWAEISCLLRNVEVAVSQTAERCILKLMKYTEDGGQNRIRYNSVDS